MSHEPQAKQTERQSLQTDPIRDYGPSPAGQEPKGRGRLLIVEDSHAMQRLICSFLEKMDMKTETAENGQMACELAEQSKAEGNPYDLVLMDIQMPHMNGYDATRWLREHGWEGPIVAVTAHTKDEDRQKCVEAGCDDHLAKPINEMALWNVVERHLEGRVVSTWSEMAV